MKNKFAILLVCLIIVFFVLSGCSSTDTPAALSTTEEVTLWVVTDETTSDGMNHLVNLRAEEFAVTYPNVTVKVDILPSEEEERTVYLEEIREKMEQGIGPDVFLFSTRNVLTLEHPKKYTYLRVEQLIPDVEKAMYEGLFADISTYYKADSTLGKDALNKKVMDAGTIGKARYVLPLRYDMPVYYVTEEFDTYGIDRKIFSKPFGKWMETVIDTGDQRLACGAERNSISVHSDLIDYKKNTATISQEELVSYAQLSRQVQLLVKDEADHRSRPLTYLYAAFDQESFPVHIASLSDALDAAAIARARGQELSMYAVRTLDGDVLADVDYYGAVGASCQNVGFAYEFLRGFLTEEYQWEDLRPLPASEQDLGLLAQAWPVRYKDAVESLWEKLKYQVESVSLVPGTSNAVDAILAVELEEADVPVLTEKIDIVRFPITMPEEYWQMLVSYDHAADSVPELPDVDALADTVIAELQATLAE